MSEEDCIPLCREKITRLLGPKTAEKLNLPTFTQKEQCKQIMLELFGPVSAAKVDDMADDVCVEQCRQKVAALLGEQQAKRFDRL